MNKWTRNLLYMLLIVVITGCQDQHILERQGFTQTMSYDLAPEEQVEVTLSVPKADPKSITDREVLTTVASGSKEARIKLSRQSDLQLVSGQLRNVLFGLSLAKQGLAEFTDTLVRDPAIGPHLKLIIVNGHAGQILQKNFSQHPRTGKYIDKLMEKEENDNSVPRTTLLSFVRDYYDDGIDPVAPMIKSLGSSLTTDGIALFKDDKFIAKINSEDALIFAFLRGSLRQGEISLKLEKEAGHADNNESRLRQEIVMLSSIISSRKVKVSNCQNNHCQIDIHLNIEGSVLEYIGNLKLSIPTDRKQLERRMSTDITSKAEKLINYIQKRSVDSLGLGQYVRNSMSFAAWNSLDWKTEYPQIKVNCKVEVIVKNYGKMQ
ncbi:Ger(x)C family spore germination protein [Paenibacillus paridis]|uniref:Ger(x)C family spore germination protein n=1 Tax=Paenibacillus paridis TaxID=2583376 RepID=UPI00111F3B52|nr:Ger(x)C family spore germination protein [Paenibacillus paridis]